MKKFMPVLLVLLCAASAPRLLAQIPASDGMPLVYISSTPPKNLPEANPPVNDLARYEKRAVGLRQVFQWIATVDNLPTHGPEGSYLAFEVGLGVSDSAGKPHYATLTVNGQELTGRFIVFVTDATALGMNTTGWYRKTLASQTLMLGYTNVVGDAILPTAPERVKNSLSGDRKFTMSRNLFLTRNSAVAGASKQQPANQGKANVLYPFVPLNEVTVVQEAASAAGSFPTLPAGFFELFIPGETIGKKSFTITGMGTGCMHSVRPATRAEILGTVKLPTGTFKKVIKEGFHLLMTADISKPAG